MIKLLAKYCDNINWKIILSMNNDGLYNVSLTPFPKVKDDAIKLMAPIILKGYTLEELEEIDSDTLESALTKVQSLVSNIDTYEKGVDEQAKNTKMAKDKKQADKDAKEKAKKLADKTQEALFDKANEGEVALDL